MAKASAYAGRGRVAGSNQRAFHRQPHHAPGRAYFAIKGDVHDGMIFVDAALKAGAGLAAVAAAQRNSPPMRRFGGGRCSLLVLLAHASRARLGARRSSP